MHIQTKLARKAHVILIISLFVRSVGSFFVWFIFVCHLIHTHNTYTHTHSRQHIRIQSYFNRTQNGRTQKYTPNNFAPNSKLILPIFLIFHDSPRDLFHNYLRASKTESKREQEKLLPYMYVSIERRPPHAATNEQNTKTKLTQELCTNVYLKMVSQKIRPKKNRLWEIKSHFYCVYFYYKSEEKKNVRSAQKETAYFLVFFSFPA